MEESHFAARFAQRRQELPRGLGRAQRIKQQAHLHAGPRPFDQCIAHPGTGAVWFEDVVLEVDMVAGSADGGDQRIERCRAIDQ